KSVNARHILCKLGVLPPLVESYRHLLIAGDGTSGSVMHRHATKIPQLLLSFSKSEHSDMVIKRAFCHTSVLAPLTASVSYVAKQELTLLLRAVASVGTEPSAIETLQRVGAVSVLVKLVNDYVADLEVLRLVLTSLFFICKSVIDVSS